MLAELAAFTAAYKTVKGAVQAGRELSSVASQIGTMVQSKEKLQKDLQRKKNSPFSRQVETDLEEFLALEDIRNAEHELEQMMIYGNTRAGLRDDWLRYQAEARKRRQEAERQAEKEREELLEFIQIVMAVAFAVGAVVAAIYYLGVYMGKW